MKKCTLFLLIIISLGFVFQSCKKGDNDPFLSLRSRMARITGVWELTSGTKYFTEDDSSNTVNYDGINAYSLVDTFPYTLKWTIEKEGTFVLNAHNSGVVFTYKGLWSFGHKIKEIDLKNKESIIFRYTYYNVVYNGGTGNYTETYSGYDCPVDEFRIDQLKNKELIVITEGSTQLPDFTQSSSGSITFTKEKKK